jgi:hypothetical protein
MMLAAAWCAFAAPLWGCLESSRKRWKLVLHYIIVYNTMNNKVIVTNRVRNKSFHISYQYDKAYICDYLLSKANIIVSSKAH